MACLWKRKIKQLIICSVTLSIKQDSHIPGHFVIVRGPPAVEIDAYISFGAAVQSPGVNRQRWIDPARARQDITVSDVQVLHTVYLTGIIHDRVLCVFSDHGVTHSMRAGSSA